jgi:predicted short-subunit dehydrogenase-like oxidoreductase (DUF2520 family)
MTTLNVLGCGRVGQTLARLLHVRGTCRIQDLAGRSEARARHAAAFIGEGRPAAAILDMRPADIWMLTVPDTEIAHVAAELAAAGVAQSAIAFHCSGFFPAAALDPLRRSGCSLASVHPALTFADPQTAIAQFAGTPCGLEGDEHALDILRPMFTAIGGRCFSLASERKPLYHAAAVFASNLSVVLQVIAREAWTASGVPDDVAGEIHASLARAATDNVLKLGAAAITGPAARGDTHVVEREIEEVSRWHPEAGAVYRDLSVLARRLAQHRSTQHPGGEYSG